MEICKKELCTGCGVCRNICNMDAIRMIPDEKGFLYPSIDTKKCVACHLCVNRCPQNTSVEKNALLKSFAALSKNDDIRNNSTSGGVFSEISSYILKKNGAVIGAALMPDMTVSHIAIENENELYKLRGSKYVQSDTKKIYIQVKKYLDKKRMVLFSGTPCQVAGLKTINEQK